MTVSTTGTTSTAANSFGVSSTASTTAVSGLGSGIDTTAIINALMTVNGQTKTNLQTQQTANNTKISDYQDLNTKMLALQSAARSLQGVNDWQQVVAASSNPTVASATATSGGSAGAVTFSVQNLATANVVATGLSVASTSSAIASGPLFVASSGFGLGLRTVSGDASLSMGNHAIVVTQASSGAAVTGAAPAPPVTIAAGTNDTFTAVVNGQNVSYQLPPGTYSTVQLAAAIATASAGALKASVDGATGGLKVSTANEGSAASLQITGGSALSSLGLSAGAAVTGSDGIITVDGTSTTLSNLVPGSSVSLPSGTGGSVTAVLDGHLAVGSMSGSQISTGDGSLSAVVSAINASNQGVSASAIRTGDNAYRLQLSSQTTGADAQINVSGAAFAGAGGLHTVSAGADALLHVGGDDGYDVTSSTNTITGLMPGVNVTLTGTTPVGGAPTTITATQDASGMADKVNTFVTAANTLLDQLNTYGGYNTTTQVAGDLMGDGALMSLRRQVLNLVGTVRTGPSGTGVDSTGVNLTADGHLSFDRTAFLTAFTADPAGTAARFSSGGALTASSAAYTGAASFVYAPGTVSAGSYAITVSQSATKGGTTGAAVSGTLASAETLSVRSGTTVATFAANAGQSLQDVAAGLNAAATKSGIGVTASVVTDAGGTHLALTAQSYGTPGSFDFSSTGTGSGLATTPNAWTTYAGLDVAGTIGGVAATGNGQTLSVPAGTAGTGGLAVQITAADIPAGSNVALGTFGYTPGVAASMEGLSEQFADPIKGDFAFSLTQLNALNKGLATQISDADVLLTQQRSLLQDQFNAMETAIASLKSTGDMLTSALASSSSS